MSVRTSNDSASINHVKSIILKMWQDLHNDHHQVVLVGATNNPEMVDPAFLKRVEHRIHVKLPSLEAKSKILKLHLRDRHHTLKRNDIHEKAITTAKAKLALELTSCGTWEKVNICRFPQ